MPKGIDPNARPPKPEGAMYYEKGLWLKISKGRVFMCAGYIAGKPHWIASNRDVDRVRTLIEERNYGS